MPAILPPPIALGVELRDGAEWSPPETCCATGVEVRTADVAISPFPAVWATCTVPDVHPSTLASIACPFVARALGDGGSVALDTLGVSRFLPFVSTAVYLASAAAALPPMAFKHAIGDAEPDSQRRPYPTASGTAPLPDPDPDEQRWYMAKREVKGGCTARDWVLRVSEPARMSALQAEAMGYDAPVVYATGVLPDDSVPALRNVVRSAMLRGLLVVEADDDEKPGARLSCVFCVDFCAPRIPRPIARFMVSRFMIGQLVSHQVGMCRAMERKLGRALGLGEALPEMDTANMMSDDNLFSVVSEASVPDTSSTSSSSIASLRDTVADPPVAAPR